MDLLPMMMPMAVTWHSPLRTSVANEMYYLIHGCQGVSVPEDGRRECIKRRRDASREPYPEECHSSSGALLFCFRMKGIIAAFLVFAPGAAANRTFTVYNACSFTVWYV